MLTGDEGILNKSAKATIETEIAEIEEEANLIYQHGIIEKTEGTINDISMDYIVSGLISKGYPIEQATLGEEINGISLDRSYLTIPQNVKATIKVKLEGNHGYYAVLKNNYYKMSENNGKIIIERNSSQANNSGSEKTLEAKVTSGDNISVEKIENNIITLNSKDKTGSSDITVTYGDVSKTCNVVVLTTPASEETQEVPTFSTDYGLIDVIWLNEKTNEVSTKPNEPDLYEDLADKKLEPVTWKKITDENGKEIWQEDEVAQNIWYEYIAGTEAKDEKKSRWANAKNTDGSYFVWIPRYAYRITYYSDPEYKNMTGFYDGHGMWNAVDGVLNYKIDEGIETAEYNGNKYIVHPAFVNNIENGGWDTELTGIWVSKFEMSRESATLEDAGTMTETKFRSVPNVQSAGYIRIKDMFTYSMQYDGQKESHMMKNSEYGVVAYLAQSQYGRNGNEIDYNNSSKYITGNGAGDIRKNSNKVDYIANPYNTDAGAKASTTGNIYGIYDFVGGRNIYVAAFNMYMTDQKADWGSSFAGTDKESTKYATKYTNEEGDSTSGSAKTIYAKGKIGDATKEVRGTSTSKNWFGDFSEIISKDNPYLLRGYAGASQYGLFSAWSSTGYENNVNGFHVVLAENNK